MTTRQRASLRSGEARLLLARRAGLHRPTVHPPQWRGDGYKPREDKAIAAAWRPGKRLAKEVAVYFDGRVELRSEPVKTRT